MEVDLEVVELQPLLREQCQFFQPDTIRKDIELIIDCQVKSVYADEIKLKQVLGNLLNNAFKFTQQGKINLRVITKMGTIFSEEEPLVEISLSDTGIGI